MTFPAAATKHVSLLAASSSAAHLPDEEHDGAKLLPSTEKTNVRGIKDSSAAKYACNEEAVVAIDASIREAAIAIDASTKEDVASIFLNKKRCIARIFV